MVEINGEISELLDKQMWWPKTKEVGGNRKEVCEENKEKNDCVSKKFLMTGTTFEECYRRINKQMKMKLTTMKLHETKALLVE